MYEIVVDEDELLAELQNLMDYWPPTVEELPVGQWYPRMATISKSCTVMVWRDTSGKVH